MLGVNVRGGTSAGRKRPPKERRKTWWPCIRGHVNPPYATRCLTDGCADRRPE